MKTNKELIFNALIILNNEEISLEVAISKASQKTGLFIIDDIKIIRDFLRRIDLLNHNPRLTFPNYREPISGGISIVYDKVDDNFINDHLTDNCKDLINKNLLRTVLFEER